MLLVRETRKGRKQMRSLRKGDGSRGRWKQEPLAGHAGGTEEAEALVALIYLGGGCVLGAGLAAVGDELQRLSVANSHARRKRVANFN